MLFSNDFDRSLIIFLVFIALGGVLWLEHVGGESTNYAAVISALTTTLSIAVGASFKDKKKGLTT